MARSEQARAWRMDYFASGINFSLIWASLNVYLEDVHLIRGSQTAKRERPPIARRSATPGIALILFSIKTSVFSLRHNRPNRSTIS